MAAAAAAKYFGGGGSVIVAGDAPGVSSVLVGGNGDQLYSYGSTGDLFGAEATGDLLMSGINSTGNDVFFGAAGTGTLTFITGSGNDILGLGQGSNLVTLGAGNSTVFGNASAQNTTITAGTGSAAIGFAGRSEELDLSQVMGTAHSFALYNFVPGADGIFLGTVSSNVKIDAVGLEQTVANGSATIVVGQTSITFIGTTHVGTNVFA